MSNHDIVIRAALPGDARALAEFVDMAGEGLASYLWLAMAEPGESVWDVGERRARRTEGGFSFKHSRIAERNGEPAAGLIGYRLPDQPVDIGNDFPPMFAPLQELENLVCGAWYINVLAVYPQFRNQGLGGTLLRAAENDAQASHCELISLVVFDRNRRARALYERHGYSEIAKREIVKEHWRCDSTAAVLMVKALAA